MSIPTVLDQYPMPPCATLLGLDILAADPTNGRVTIAFTAGPEFCNAVGNVQGGFLSAMLDDCLGPAVLVATNAELFPSTINLNVQFLAPARPGVLIGRARIVQLGKTIGFVEGELEARDGLIVAKATASVRLTATDRVAP